MAGADGPPPYVETVEKQKKIRGYWNAGILAARRDVRLLLGVAGAVAQAGRGRALPRRQDDGHRPGGDRGRGLAAARSLPQPRPRLQLQHRPPPLLQGRDEAGGPRRDRPRPLPPVVQPAEGAADLRPPFDPETEQYRWLDEQLPLQPTVKAPLPKPGGRQRLRAWRSRGAWRSCESRCDRSARPEGRTSERRPPAPFVVGVPRSGTTMLRLMLDAHPEMAIPPETYFVTNLIEAGDEGADRRAARRRADRPPPLGRPRARRGRDPRRASERRRGARSAATRCGRPSASTPRAGASRGGATRRPPT